MGQFTNVQWGLFAAAIVLICLISILAMVAWSGWRAGAPRRFAQREARKGLEEYRRWKSFHPGEGLDQ